MSENPSTVVDLSNELDIARIRRMFQTAVRQACPPAMANDVEDLVQDAMVKLLTMQERGREPGTMTMSYVRKTTYSLIVDAIRYRSRRPEQGTDAGEHAESVVDPVSSVADPATGAAIEDCLSRQVDDRRRAVTLSLLGHSIKEVGELLGLKAKNAENLIYRGLAQLRACLSEKGYAP